jgi:hypothetical protein
VLVRAKMVAMSDSADNDWSPADYPYAIAVSESQWLRATVALTVERMHGDDIHVGWFSSRQIDARTLAVALRQLLAAEKLEQIALKELGIDPAVGAALRQARLRFEDALPDIKHVRDGITHFEDWSRGQGQGPQRVARDAGAVPREVARDHWSFGYDPVIDNVTMGPYTFSVAAALPATAELCDAIYAAACAVDARNTAEIRQQTVQALTDAAIGCEPPAGQVLVSPGGDLRIWLSLVLAALPEDDGIGVAERVVTAISDAGLRLESSTYPQAVDMAQRMADGETLRVRSQ